ncbi:MAG TPA: hypothetical protein VFF33_05210 [Ignavibacteriaceae bacterium]|nr:hypothetical protein [Ignavibacteriaceae bacterium]
MKNQYIIFKKNPVFGKCPSCNKVNTLHHSKIRNFKEMLTKNFTFFKMYRCSQCGWRGYLSTLTLTKTSLKNIAIYLAFGAAAALIVREVIIRITL